MLNPRAVRTWILAHRPLSVLIVVLAIVMLALGLRFLTPSVSDGPRAAQSPTYSTNGSDEVEEAVTTDSTPDPTAMPSTRIPSTADPDVFARSVAEALLRWDTASTNLPDLTEQLLSVADPTGTEAPGLLMDLRTYLPSPKAWTHLGQYQTRQRLEVTSVTEPAAWREALAQAPDGAVAEGTTARTVTGARHRAGTWDGEPAAASSRVQFTIFMVCGPAYDQCHLLRLSTSDAALH